MPKRRTAIYRLLASSCHRDKLLQQLASQSPIDREAIALLWIVNRLALKRTATLVCLLIGFSSFRAWHGLEAVLQAFELFCLLSGYLSLSLGIMSGGHWSRLVYSRFDECAILWMLSFGVKVFSLVPV
jgi:hypothetical protein